MSTVYYIAGPMTSIPQFNFPAFFEARDTLTAKGFTVELPWDMNDPATVHEALASPDGKSAPNGFPHTYAQCLGQDVELLISRCQGIILLPGWEKSKGARLEASVGLLWGFRFAHYWKEFQTITPAPAITIAHEIAHSWGVR